MSHLANKDLMCSTEIAELTSKNHADVMRDIRVMLEKLEIGLSKFASSYLNSQNKSQPCFDLPRRECEILITGYDVVRRAKVIDRWYDLETGKALPMASPVDQLAFAEIAARMMNLQGSAMLGLIRKVQDNNGIPNMLPDYTEDKPTGIENNTGSLVCDSASALLKIHSPTTSAMKFNKMAKSAGYLKQETRVSTKHANKVKKYWSVTEVGSAFGKNVTSDRNQNETTPRWYSETFLHLINELKGVRPMIIGTEWHPDEGAECPCDCGGKLAWSDDDELTCNECGEIIE